MNTKDNIRSIETRKKLQDAFLEILRETNLEKVNVTSICKKVGVNRSLFYYYYEDIYALANEIQGQIHDKISSLFGEERENLKTAIIAGENKRQSFIQLFELIKNNQNFFNLYFMNHFYVHSFNDLSYKHCFYTAGVRALAAQWIERGCKESPEMMADQLIQIL